MRNSRYYDDKKKILWLMGGGQMGIINAKKTRFEGNSRIFWRTKRKQNRDMLRLQHRIKLACRNQQRRRRIHAASLQKRQKYRTPSFKQNLRL